MPSARDPTKAIVKNVIREVERPYVVTATKEGQYWITFSLKKSVWDESSDPEIGELVLLSGIYATSGGYRSKKAKRIHLGDIVNE